MNHYLIPPLFFFYGALASWLFFAWKMDNSDSVMKREIGRLEKESLKLLTENELLTEIIIQEVYDKIPTAELIYKLAMNPVVAHKLECIFKEASKQQEKQKCQE